jgi:hypothetical protein
MAAIGREAIDTAGWRAAPTSRQAIGREALDTGAVASGASIKACERARYGRKGGRHGGFGGRRPEGPA